MTLTRLLTLAALSACLALPGAAAATEPGGGAVAPAAEPSAAPSAVAVSVEPGEDEAAPEAAQEDTPTTPEGEEQPPDEENGDEQPPGDEDGDDDGNGGTGGAGGGEAGGGTLPRTGFEVAALSAIGLGLLLAGGALWPTSSWPPPRDRLSRSAQRR